MLEEPISKIFQKKDTLPERESSSFQNINMHTSFSNMVGPNEVLPYKSLIKENIKSFNLLPNEEKSSKENELENSLKAKYNFDTPTLELVLKVTSDYENIKEKLKEYLDLFGENTLVKYDHNANTVKINYKYYFSCLYANRSLNNILQKENENANPMNYYSNCELSNKSITSTMSSEKYQNKPKSNKDLSQAFKFLTENYKTSAKFKTQIYKEENEKEFEDKSQIEEVNKNNEVISNSSSNNDDVKNKGKSLLFTSQLNIQKEERNNLSNARTRYKTGNNNYSYSTNRKRFKSNFSNPMNNIYNLLLPQNLYYQYLSMNNPNTIKIPVPVPVPVPFPLSIPKQKTNKSVSFNNNNFSSFANPKIKSSFLKQIKEDIGAKLIKENSEIKSNDMNESSPSIEEKKEIMPINDNSKDSPFDNSKNNSQKISEKINESQESKEKSCDAIKKEINISNSLEKESVLNEKNSNNSSGNSSKEAKQKAELISSIKSNDKSSIDFLSNMDNKKHSLERLNNFLQNNKPISNFNNPIKNLTPDEMMESNSKTFKRMHPLPMFVPKAFPNLLQFPFKFPKYNNNPYMMNIPFPIGFNKNVINFNKLTLNTRNNIKFETHSSRDYYYKYVCNYLVQIENDDNFLVTKRIIGKNGCFLKKIIQEACIKYGDFSTKIRLRGKGSGYIEHNGKESEEPLMLCVSSLNYPTYFNCCSLIDSLFEKVYNDYYEYSLKMVPEELRNSLTRKQVLKHEFVVNRFGSNSSGNKENNDSNNKSNNDKNISNIKIDEEAKK